MNSPQDLPAILPVTNEMLNRRRFLKQSVLAGSLAAMSAPAFLRGQNLNSKINIAAIGCGGKGDSDIKNVDTENIVALCDIDETRAAGAFKRYPNARRFTDYRKMYDAMGKEFDAITVSTPDHHHALATAIGLKMGKHAYVQKPLTHSVWEARLLRRLAKENKVATQMGNQGSAEDGLRRAVEVVQSGAIGEVREVHLWSNRPIWKQGIPRPAASGKPPANMDWDLFLGPAPERPFVDKAYHPFEWRGWVDFGTGALGDMACHTANMPFRALNLGYPTSIEASSSGMNGETWPAKSQIKFEFPKRGKLPPLTFYWYDGGNKPGGSTTAAVEDFIASQKDKNGKAMARALPGSGCLLMGTKGQLYSPDDYGARFFLLPQDQFIGYKGPAETIPRAPKNSNQGLRHHIEWLEAIRGGKPAYSNFDIAAYLTEIILLGCVALRAGQKIEWDGPAMRATNIDVSHLVKRDYRKGWEIPA